MKTGSGKLLNRLQTELTRIQNERAQYSLRAFARDLNIPAPVLSEVLRGRRPITQRLGQKICEGLRLSPTEAEELLAPLEQRLPLDHLFVQIQTSEFNAVSDWHYFAILALAETQDFRGDVKWISSRMGLPLARTTEAVETLIRLGLLEMREKKLHATGKTFTTTHDVPSVAIQKNHIQGLELARQALRSVDVTEREYGANTIAIDSDELPILKSMIRDARRRLAVKMGRRGRQKKQVYRLQIQFFPLSKGST